MKKDEGIDKRSQIEILKELDLKRNEAQIEMFKIKALLSLCIESEFLSQEAREEWDCFSMFSILRNIADNCEKHLEEVERLITLAERRSPGYKEYLQKLGFKGADLERASS